jgi:hypothetical protein
MHPKLDHTDMTRWRINVVTSEVTFNVHS